MGSKETNCATCIHREVCALKADFLEAQHAVSNLTYTHERDGSIVRLADVPFIVPVNLQCKFWFMDIHKRSDYDSSASTAISTHDYGLGGAPVTTLRG